MESQREIDDDEQADSFHQLTACCLGCRCEFDAAASVLCPWCRELASGNGEHID